MDKFLRFKIQFSPEAVRNLEDIPKEFAEKIVQDVERFLSEAPFRSIKTRIKKLQHMGPSLYCLRVGDYRVYYRIQEKMVLLLKIMHKKDSDRWLKSIR